MKWTLADLLQSNSGNVSFDEDIEIDASAFANNSRINSVKDVHVSGHGYLDEEENRFYVQLNVSGTMIVPDAITNEEIEYLLKQIVTKLMFLKKSMKMVFVS